MSLATSDAWLAGLAVTGLVVTGLAVAGLVGRRARESRGLPMGL